MQQVVWILSHFVLHLFDREDADLLLDLGLSPSSVLFLLLFMLCPFSSLSFVQTFGPSLLCLAFSLASLRGSGRLSYSPVRSRSKEEVPLQQRTRKCPLLFLCLGSGAFGTTIHGTPALRLHSKSIPTISGGCVVYGKSPSLHCCSSWMCLFSFVYLTSFGGILALTSLSWSGNTRPPNCSCPAVRNLQMKPFTPFTSCIPT